MRYYKTGLTEYDEDRATRGYTLFSPINQKKTYIIDLQGTVVHEWDWPLPPGNYAYLLENGNILRACRTDEGPQGMAAGGGLIQEVDWDGNVVWEHIDHAQHHDFRRCANGNTIYLGWELIPEEAHSRVRGGAEGSEHEDGIYGDYLREVTPGGETAWEWHAATDDTMPDHPICPIEDRREFAHANTVCPLANGDVMISFRQNHMIGIIDRETRTFKWVMSEMEFGHQHDCHMLENGNIMLFANGDHTHVHGGRTHSRVIEIDPADNEIKWTYEGDPPYTFYSPHISGAQRLASGNTLICEGLWGRFFEVTPGGDIVWEYINPYFVAADAGPGANANSVFRAYRYAADSPEIAGRLG